jgi:predicted DNA-binding protein (UPF0251 family)/predicted Fe-Mo cluster-binding NifX family protein
VPRQRCRRRVGFFPDLGYVQPFGGSPYGEVVLGLDEVEAVRLKDLLSFPQEEAARIMGISQPTFHRILKEARRKIADAVVNRKTIRIEGGPYAYDPHPFRPCRWTRGWGASCEELALAAEREIRSREAKEGDGMKVAVTSTGDTLESLVDERFGRAKKIILCDLDTDSFQVVENGLNLSLSQGAGIQTAKNLIELGAKAVISGHFGPNAVRVLQAASIELFQALGISVRDAIERLKDGRLQRLYGPDRGPHW